MTNHLAAHTATQIISGLSSGEHSLEDVNTALREQHRAVNGDINAFESISDQDSSQTTAPLLGLPITVKDQIAVAGMPLNHGLEKTNRNIPSETAPVVQRLLDAGARVWGKTTLPPYAMDFQTFSKRTGITRNPWNLERTAGGSSGGGAAAVAAGMSYLDIGADLSGSLRLPAAYCGVFSLMPTDGAVDTTGLMPNDAVLKNFARPGVIARSAEDLELAWSAIDGARQTATDKASYNIACWDSASNIPVDPEVAATFEAVRAQLSVPGLSVSSTDQDDSFTRAAYACFGEIMGYETGGLMPAPIRLAARVSGKSAARRSPNFLQHVHTGYRRDKAAYQKALRIRETLQEAFDSSWVEQDALLLPVCGVQPFAHQRPRRERAGLRDYESSFNLGGTEVGYFDALTAFTVPISLMGNPVVTIPLGLDSQGLPVGGQLVGRRGGEAELLQLAQRVSSFLPYLQNPYLPALAAGLC